MCDAHYTHTESAGNLDKLCQVWVKQGVGENNPIATGGRDGNLIWNHTTTIRPPCPHFQQKSVGEILSSCDFVLLILSWLFTMFCAVQKLRIIVRFPSRMRVEGSKLKWPLSLSRLLWTNSFQFRWSCKWLSGRMHIIQGLLWVLGVPGKGKQNCKCTLEKDSFGAKMERNYSKIFTFEQGCWR